MNVIFTGSGEFGVPTLRALLRTPHRIVQVISQPDRPAGRGRGLTPTAISQVAAEANLPLLRTGDINSERLPPADLMIVIAFGQKIADAVVHHSRLGSINLHASRLPKYRGAAPINWAIIRGEEFTGNSVIRLAQKMDAGAILGQSSLKIGDTETAGELHDRLADDGVELALKTIASLESGTAVESPQDETLATLSPKLSRASARLDFSQSAIDLARRIRGLYPWPGCRVAMCDAAGAELTRLRLARARPGPTEGDRWEPGEIMVDGFVQTGSGGLEILTLQPEGGNVMSLVDYRRGHKWPPGARLRAVE
ncbi:MAG TPA: methionyl-tRNA formyltransferase [Tepidisphaeraceae bacterium]|jgi:methionyl-tRNA formyltransferase|nr:methionyl-tRNA formyltransferase [Tepidisphaeraceae bacterium]